MLLSAYLLTLLAKFQEMLAVLNQAGFNFQTPSALSSVYLAQTTRCAQKVSVQSVRLLLTQHKWKWVAYTCDA